ncbi:hypothetical protein [Paenibacillus validus]|uniref:Uncharacterized protein n=1 Tax=Paenibacillus validus TaxID=44253 RepID=A0A7X3CVI2_9BACL|nr:hypothetical protein [Paenibacillus validus]MUG73212.1 hypothetical protein [Paenibacillus validus]
MQRGTRTTFNQPNRSTPAQANMTTSGQSRAASPQVNRATVSQAGGAGSQSSGTGNVNAVVCRKCKSPQVVANKRGYSFANMFKTLGIMILIGILSIVFVSFEFMYGTGSSPSAAEAVGVIGMIVLFLSLPTGILVGFAGRSELINGCMNCGFKWRPAKRK